VLFGRYMDELEVEKEYGSDPSVDRSIRLYVGVAEHTFDVTSIHFDDEVVDSDEMKVGGTEHAEELIKLELGL
jgi:hypothetical protein